MLATGLVGMLRPPDVPAKEVSRPAACADSVVHIFARFQRRWSLLKTSRLLPSLPERGAIEFICLLALFMIKFPPTPRALAVVLPFVWLLGLLAGCSKGSAEKSADIPPAFTSEHGVLRVPDGSPLRSRLVVDTVQMREAPHTLAFPATVEADPARTANILPALTGKVTALKVGLGDRVASGQVLAVVDSGDLALAYADEARSRDALDLAKKALERSRGVRDAGGAATKDLEAAQSTYNQAAAESDRAQMRLRAVGGEGGGKSASHAMNVISPISGNVIALSVTPGVFVNDPAVSMMTIANLDAVWITANVPENEAGLIANRQHVDATLAAFPGEVFHGEVSFVTSVLEPDTRRNKVRIAVDNRDGRLKPNMFASASFAIPEPAQIFVPETALLMNNDSVSVFVEVSPWVFQRRTVELSYDESAGARVVKGLKAGERVIVKGGVLLND
jgi:cobalt-zinc-cadmium efflux system membrane fusion protein